MRRAVLAVTVVLLAAGCGSDCDEPATVTFLYGFAGSRGARVGEFRPDDPATPVDEAGCATTGTHIEVTIEGATTALTCEDEAGFPAVAYEFFSRGRYPYRIDAVRNDKVAFTASGEVDAPRCGNVDVQVRLQAVSPSDLFVFYDVDGVPLESCAAGGRQIANVPFELRNASGHTAATSCLSVGADGACTLQGQNACDPSSRGFDVPDLPHGQYTFEYLYTVDPAGEPSAAACSVPVVHEGFFVVLDLAPIAPGGCACPATAKAVARPGDGATAVD
jgi:hypothetical protein